MLLLKTGVGPYDMNIELLEKLGKTVKPGHTRFGNLNVAFSLARYFSLGNAYVPRRPDLGDPVQYNATACLVGFTFLVAGMGPALLKRPEDDFRSENMYFEAKHLLALVDDQSFELFHGCINELTTGEQASRAIRGLIITGKVDWWSVRK
jgi:hypothetical protein